MATSDLRKSILQYAMQGKLVKQDPNDEPASILLEKIEKEKKQLIKEGKIKLDKNESIIYRGDDNHYYEKIGNTMIDITEYIPFEVPDSWCFTRLHNIAKIINGFAFKSNLFVDDGIRIIRISDFNSDGIIAGPYKRYLYFDKLENFKIKCGDILICMTGGTVGKNCIINHLEEDSYINQRVGIIRNDCICNGRLLHYFLNTPSFMEYVLRRKNSTNDNISSEDINNYFVPLPPLAEQQRIVNKLEELEPYITEYEQLVEENEQLDKEFPDKLKQSILQYAMQGKLVKQDPNDEPASVLLGEIKQEKEKLIREGKIKKGKNESIIYRGDDKNYYEKIGNNITNITDEIPFEIPDSWCFTRLHNIAKIINGFAFKSNLFVDDGIRIIRISDFNSDGIIAGPYKRYLYFNKLDDFKIKLGDILICMTGGTVGKNCIIKHLEEDSYINQRVGIIRNNCICNEHLLHYFLNTPNFMEYVLKRKNSTNDNISSGDINNYFVPLPPLAEQKRIVNKIESIFSLL